MSSNGPDVIFPAFFGVFFLFWLFIVALSLVATVFWIVELIDVCRRDFPDPNAKLVWILVLIFSHGVGALVYYFVGKPQGWLPRQGGPPPHTGVNAGPWPPGG